jgi:D-sedoheptulose 7-phosphate isomerase
MRSAKEWLAYLRETKPEVAGPYGDIVGHPGLSGVAEEAASAYEAIVRSLESGGTLYLCGNGGSFADAMHISGEMLKSFVRPRPLPPLLAERLRAGRFGPELEAHLQAGLRAHVLGANPVLASAVANDIPVAGIGYAQELVALGRAGDVFMGISTSGGARNVRMAAAVAHALHLTTIGLTGAPGERNALAREVDIPLSVTASETYRIQELHLALYHALCLMVEAHFSANH